MPTATTGLWELLLVRQAARNKMSESIIGIIFAVASAVANGSFSVLAKIGPVKRAEVQVLGRRADFYIGKSVPRGIII